MTSYILTGAPPAFEEALFNRYREIERNFRERRWEPAELNGGKLCEAAFSILKGHIDGHFPAAPSKPSNFQAACAALEKSPSHHSRSLRVLIPRVMVALYDIRNSRSVGHIGGEVDPNHMDALCVLHMAKWVVAEIVRVFHNVPVDEATNLVEALSERELALVWNTGAVRRVLDVRLTMLEKTLVLLYSDPSPFSEGELLKSLEHSNPSVYRRDILRKAHKIRLLEYDEGSKEVRISPLGIRKVEEEILPKAVT
jgi:hypothetical protein